MYMYIIFVYTVCFSFVSVKVFKLSIYSYILLSFFHKSFNSIQFTIYLCIFIYNNNNNNNNNNDCLFVCNKQ